MRHTNILDTWKCPEFPLTVPRIRVPDFDFPEVTSEHNRHGHFLDGGFVKAHEHVFVTR